MVLLLSLCHVILRTHLQYAQFVPDTLETIFYEDGDCSCLFSFSEIKVNTLRTSFHVEDYPYFCTFPFHVGSLFYYVTYSISQSENISTNLYFTTPLSLFILAIPRYLCGNYCKLYYCFLVLLQLHFSNCINALLNICDIHALSFLSRTLTPAAQQLLKTFHASYNKYYRFTGKV